MHDEQSRASRDSWIPYAVIAVIAVALYLPTLTFNFVLDDDHLIVNNAFLKEPWSPLRAFAHHFWYGSRGFGYYRPIVAASFALNGRLLGWGPAGFHLVNVLLHALNAVLLLALARRLALPIWAAALAAALFAVHPVAAWPVASIVARVDLLPALFVLLAWYSYTSCARDGPASRPRRTLGRAALTGLFFLLALLSKESAVAFLAVPVMGLRRMRDDRNDTAGPAGRRGAWYGLSAAVLALLVYAATRATLRIGVYVPPDPVTNPLSHLPFPGRTYAALRLSGRYLLYLLAPMRFVDPADYSQGMRSASPADAGLIVSALFLLGWIVTTGILWWRRERLSIPLAFALGSFLPASNLLVPIGSLYALNFLYLPLLGVCLTTGELAVRLSRSDAASTVTSARPPRKALWLASPILLLMAIGSTREASIWRDSLSLFFNWTRRFPAYSFAHDSLGVSLLTNGQTEAAIEAFRRALALDDRNVDAHLNLGAALTHSSRGKEELEEALAETRRAIELDPKLVEPHGNAGEILLLLGRPAEAETEARQALLIIPDDLAARRTLADSLFQQERYREAAAEVKTLAQIDPTNPDLRSSYVVSLLKAGDLAEARRQAEAARRDFPGLAWFDFCLARVEARSSHRAEALALLRSSMARDQGTREWIGKVSDFDSYRGSTDFEALLAAGAKGTGPH